MGPGLAVLGLGSRGRFKQPGAPRSAPWEEQEPDSSWAALPSLSLPEGPAAWGYAGRDSRSEMRCQRACLSLQPEEKQKAAQQFSKLQTSMKVLGISPDEQKACWLILAAIYHLGAAGATKGNVQWVPTAQLVAPESLWRPCRSVRPHPAQTSLLADTPLLLVPLPSPPPQRRL